LPAGTRERSTARPSVSRRFVALTTQQLHAFLARPLSDLDPRVVMIDGKAFHDHCVVIAVGISSDRSKHVLGLREGTTENSRVAEASCRTWSLEVCAPTAPRCL